MMRYIGTRIIHTAMTAAALMLLSSCDGILGSVYDEPVEEIAPTAAGELYIDASDWKEWHYIDLPSVAAVAAADPSYNTSEAWETFPVPVEQTSEDSGTRHGIYTYWYDVFGEGISKNEFNSFYPTAGQEEPAEWTLAVHRNNVRTNGGAVARTEFTDMEQLPSSRDFYEALEYTPDEWNEQDVWIIQDRMLSGLIGNQGIEINNVLSSWLRIDIPPMPPAFTPDTRVFVLRLRDGSYAALQLVDYQSQTGVKCCLTLKYKYPL